MGKQIPKGWSRIRLGDIGMFSTGGVDKRIDYTLPKVRVVNYLDVYANSELHDWHPYRAGAAAKEKSEAASVRCGDILFTPSSESVDDIGRAAVFLGSADDLVYSYHLVRFRAKAGFLDDQFKAYAFRGQDTVTYFRRMAVGTTRFMLRLNELRNLELAVPPLPEQRQIAAHLQSVGQAALRAQVKLAKLSGIKMALADELIATVTRPAKSPLKVKLKDIGDLYYGLRSKAAGDFKKGEPYLTYKQVYSDTVSDPNLTGRVTVEETEPQVRVRYGDVLFTTSSENPHELALSSVFLDTQRSPYLNTFCVGLRPKEPFLIDPEFASILFRGARFREAVHPLAQGSTRFNLPISSFKNIEIQLPPLDKQREISSAVGVIDDAIEAWSMKHQKLTILHDYLMEELLSGRMRGKEAESHILPRCHK